jgi:hypothetical protein
VHGRVRLGSAIRLGIQLTRTWRQSRLVRPHCWHDEVVNVNSATAQTATVDLPRGEAVALLNLLREARRLPLEVIGPGEISGRLYDQFDRLVSDMHAGQ